jgi:hypothetical protein
MSTPSDQLPDTRGNWVETAVVMVAGIDPVESVDVLVAEAMTASKH